MPFPTPAPKSTAPRGPISSSAPPSGGMYRAKKKKPGEENPVPQNNNRLTGPPMQMGAGTGSMFANGRPQGGQPPMRMSGPPPMQHGGGRVSMLANGSTGQDQGTLPPTPNYPQGGPGPSRVQGQPQFQPPPTPNYPQMGTRVPNGQVQGAHPRGVPTSQRLANGRPMMADGRKPMMADGGMDTPPPIGGAPDDQDTAPDMDDQAGGPPEGSPAGEMPAGMPPIIKPEALNFHDEDQDCSGCTYFGQDSQCAVLQMQVGPDSGCNAWEAASAPSGQGPVDTGAGFTQNHEGTSGGPSLS